MNKLSNVALAIVLGLSFASTTAMANKKKKSSYHCEVKKDGKHVDLSKEDAPDRKACKKKGGKWVKDHDHDHEHGADGEDHEHSEDEE